MKPEKQELFRIPFVFTLLINLLPLIGVLFLNWEYFPILLFYCIEALFIYMKLSAQKIRNEQWFQSLVLPYWMKIFGVFFFSIFFVLLPLVIMLTIAVSRIENAMQSVYNVYFFASLGIMITNLIISDKPAEKTLYLSKDRTRVKNKKASKEDYLFVIIVFGTFIIVLFNIYKPALVILILIKMVIDISSHISIKRQ